ncbi:MAG: serine/threonine-protein kinase [Polyangiales bacterium]
MTNAPPPHAARPAVVVGRYRIVREIARGGMGAVFEAEQLDLGRRVALKVMLPHLSATPKLRAYFLQEAQSSARVASDHVVQVYDAGVDAAQDALWMAMELLEGESLEARLKRGPFEPREAWEILRQVGHALGAAHRVGFVHCDLKPPNIFLAEGRRHDTPLTVKVLDFGIARVIQEGATSALGTSVAGSPRFMAPEQAQRNGRIKPATDVWALALVAFRMLTGSHYWRQSDLLALLGEILLGEPCPASIRARELGVEARLPPGFDAWFDACTTRDVDARVADGAEATRRLGEVLAAPASPTRTVALSSDEATRQSAVMAYADAELRGDYEAALALWERHFASAAGPARDGLAPRAAQAFVARGRALEVAGELGEALRDGGRALALAPGLASAWYLRSRARRLLGDAGGADDLRHAAELGEPGAARELAAWRGERAV